MMRGRMLIAHESRAVRSILRRRTLVEVPEFLIDEVESEEQALDALKGCSFDLLLCDEALVGPTGQTWRERLRRMGCTRSVGFVYLVSEVTSEARCRELAAEGDCAFIDASSSSTDIAVAIAQVFDPRHKRTHRRVSIYGGRAIVSLGAVGIGADIINFSEAGMLCEFRTPAQLAQILAPADVRLTFPEPVGPCEIDGIRARLLRLYVVLRGTDHSPERLRAAWQFFHVPHPSLEMLRRAIENADADVEPAPQSTFEHA
jgi:hypothetical protein